MQAGGRRFEPGTLHKRKGRKRGPFVVQSASGESGIRLLVNRDAAEADRCEGLADPVALLGVAEWLGVVLVLDPRRVAEEPFVMPTTVEEVEKLSWGQLLYLAGENAEALGINGPGSPSLSP